MNNANSMKNILRNFLLVIFLSLISTSCATNYKNQNYAPTVLDDAKILNQETVNWIKNYSYPQGFAFIIRTVKELPQKEVGSKADEFFTEDAKKCAVPEACSRRGIYILISQNPKLIQVRTGAEIGTQARWSGLTSGTEYIQEQISSTSGDLNDGIRIIIGWLADKSPKAVDVGWIKEWILFDLTQGLYFELDKLSLPSDGFYGQYVLKPFLEARIFEENFAGTWWITYVIAAIVIMAIGYVIKLTIIAAIGKTNPPVANSMIYIIKILLKLGLAIPSAASVILLSGSRMEDQIALRASGLPGVESFTFSPQSFVIETGILLALLILVFRIIKGVADVAPSMAFASLAPERQQLIFAADREGNPFQAMMLKGVVTHESSELDYAASEDDFEKAPYTEIAGKFAFLSIKAGFRWGVLAWLFLPKALTLVTICLWVVPIAKGVLIFTKLKLQSRSGR